MPTARIAFAAFWFAACSGAPAAEELSLIGTWTDPGAARCAIARTAELE